MSRSNDVDAKARRVKKIAKLLDSNFRIGPFKFGWDAILGLLPGVGDSVASLVSTFIVYEAVNKNMSRPTIIRMIINILIDSVVGSIPLVGDFTDVFWKANERNAQLFENELKHPKPSSRNSAFWLILMGVGMVAAIILSVYLPLKLLQILLSL